MNGIVLFSVILLAALGSGLIAGVFFAFSTFVTQALARLPAREGIAAMQSINIVVVRSGFLAVFLATAVACIALIGMAFARWQSPESMFLLVGGVLYLLGSFLVTVVCNVPLNNSLATLEPSRPASANEWTRYVARWMRWNHVRTAASLLAMLAFVVAAVRL